MRIPRLAKARPAVCVSDGDGRHGVRDLGQWRIERDFIAGKVDFSIGEALAGVHIGTTGFNVVAPDLLRRERDRQEGYKESNEHRQAKTHNTPHPWIGCFYFRPGCSGMEAGKSRVRMEIRAPTCPR